MFKLATIRLTYFRCEVKPQSFIHSMPNHVSNYPWTRKLWCSKTIRLSFTSMSGDCLVHRLIWSPTRGRYLVLITPLFLQCKTKFSSQWSIEATHAEVKIEAHPTPRGSVGSVWVTLSCHLFPLLCCSKRGLLNRVVYVCRVFEHVRLSQATDHDDSQTRLSGSVQDCVKTNPLSAACDSCEAINPFLKVTFSRLNVNTFTQPK